jgi:hypothetical protein
MNNETALKLTLTGSGREIVIPYDASRGVKQTLAPIDGGADMRRSVNGRMIVVANPLFRLYATEISATDYEAPALGAVWKGHLVTVECVVPISQPVVSGSATLGRDPVSGSAECFDGDLNHVEHTRVGRTVTAAGAVLVRYRPILDCVVMAVSWDYGEFSIESNSWSISLEEVGS